MVDQFWSKAYLNHFVMSFKKTPYDTFLCLVVLASNYKFSVISVNKNKRIKMNKKFELDSNILVSQKTVWGNCLTVALRTYHL